jgi:hypothetical protein
LNPTAPTPQDNERRTPAHIVELARKVLGTIDLDPATDEAATQTIRATQTYCQREDGLHQHWHGRVFLNPPGGLVDPHTLLQLQPKTHAKGALSSAAVWWAKLVHEYSAGRVTQAIYVSFNLESMLNTQKFGAPIQACPFCVPRKRLSYPSSCGEKSASPPGASAIVYLGPDPTLFESVFSEVGYVRL